jgi:hypothetical protein
MFRRKPTDRQIPDNHANAQKSTGAGTPQDKATVAQNSRKHGLIGRFSVMPGENQEAFHNLSSSSCSTNSRGQRRSRTRAPNSNATSAINRPMRASKASERKALSRNWLRFAKTRRSRCLAVPRGAWRAEWNLPSLRAGVAKRNSTRTEQTERRKPSCRVPSLRSQTHRRLMVMTGRETRRNDIACTSPAF